MKKFMLPIMSIMILLFIISCQDDFNEKNLQENNLSSEFMMNIQVKNGLLHFDDLETFMKAQTSISDSEDRVVTDEELNEWEDNIGFKSMRQKYYDIYEAFSLVENDNHLVRFTEEYGNDVFDENGSIKMPINNENLASMLDENGKVIIGGNLHCFIDNYQIIITDQDENKLDRALSTFNSSPENGIYVLNIKKHDGNLETRTCDPYLVTTNKYESDKKISGKWDINFIQNVIITFSADGAGTYFWTTIKEVYSEMKSEKRTKGISSAFGNKWKKHRTHILFDYTWWAVILPTVFTFTESMTLTHPHEWKLSRNVTVDISNTALLTFTPAVPIIMPPFIIPHEFVNVIGHIENVNLGLIGTINCHEEADPCAEISCPSGEYCYFGNCVTDVPEPGCIEGSCPTGEQCINGQCETI